MLNISKMYNYLFRCSISLKYLSKLRVLWWESNSSWPRLNRQFRNRYKSLKNFFSSYKGFPSANTPIFSINPHLPRRIEIQGLVTAPLRWFFSFIHLTNGSPEKQISVFVSAARRADDYSRGQSIIMWICERLCKGREFFIVRHVCRRRQIPTGFSPFRCFDDNNW